MTKIIERNGVIEVYDDNADVQGAKIVTDAEFLDVMLEGVPEEDRNALAGALVETVSVPNIPSEDPFERIRGMNALEIDKLLNKDEMIEMIVLGGGSRMPQNTRAPELARILFELMNKR